MPVGRDEIAKLFGKARFKPGDTIDDNAMQWKNYGMGHCAPYASGDRVTKTRAANDLWLNYLTRPVRQRGGGGSGHP